METSSLTLPQPFIPPSIKSSHSQKAVCILNAMLSERYMVNSAVPFSGKDILFQTRFQVLDLTICLKFQAPTTQKNIKQKVLKFMCPLLNIPSVFLPKLFPLQNKGDETLVKVIEKGDLANEFLGPLVCRKRTHGTTVTTQELKSVPVDLSWHVSWPTYWG